MPSTRWGVLPDLGRPPAWAARPSRFVSWAFVAGACLLGMAAARAEGRGEAVFKRNCSICHSLDPGKNRVGPSLAGVVDRPAGSAPNFHYSSANADSRIVWTKDKLDGYLADPQGMVPGTLMLFPGLKSADDRQAVIEFLTENAGN
jgi:cytochrome c2